MGWLTEALQELSAWFDENGAAITEALIGFGEQVSRLWFEFIQPVLELVKIGPSKLSQSHSATGRVVLSLIHILDVASDVLPVIVQADLFVGVVGWLTVSAGGVVSCL